MKRRHSLLTIGMLVVASNANAAAPVTSNSVSNGTVHERTLNLPNGNSITYTAENLNGYSVAEDDIILGIAPDSDSALQNRGSGISIAANRWYDGIVPYQFASGLTDEGTITRTRQAIDHWNKNSSIRLVERTSSNAGNFKDYLEFTLSTGCASYVGRLGGRQEIWVAPTCSSGSMVHEIGHALGLLHEHTRNDRDQFIMVNYENIVSGKEHNFAIPSSNDKDYGDYDYGSIMHYGAYFFSDNGSPTISPYNDTTGVTMGQRNALSSGDLAAIDGIYNTDLALKKTTPDVVGVQESFFINLGITNQGDQGANEIMIVVPIKNSNKLVSFDGQNWECDQLVNKVVCGRASLIEYSQSSLMLNFESGYEPPTSIKVNLSSRTADYDLSNNGDVIEEVTSGSTHEVFFQETLQIANASGGESAGKASGDDSDSAGGGGMLHFLNLWFLGLFVLFRKTR